MFTELINDRAILNEELHKEYSQGFVYQQPPFRRTRIACTDTSDLLPQTPSSPAVTLAAATKRVKSDVLIDKRSPNTNFIKRKPSKC
jgi:hypothetical protein